MNKLIPSFVGQRSRITKNRLLALQEIILPKYQISSYEDIKTFNNIHIEIGSGYGDTITHLALQNPDALFIACEVYIDAISAICRKIEEESLQNIRIYKADARELISTIPNGLVNGVYLLFPDPWPKKKHHKRRIFSNSFLADINRVIAEDGKMFVATDHDSYKEHICQVIYHQSYMQWIAESPEDFTQPPAWWIQTKYQAKAIIEGRKCTFFTMQKEQQVI